MRPQMASTWALAGIQASELPAGARGDPERSAARAYKPHILLDFCCQIQSAFTNHTPVERVVMKSGGMKKRGRQAVRNYRRASASKSVSGQLPPGCFRDIPSFDCSFEKSLQQGSEAKLPR